MNTAIVIITPRSGLVVDFKDGTRADLAIAGLSHCHHIRIVVHPESYCINIITRINPQMIEQISRSCHPAPKVLIQRLV